jgi:hypothetical protein
MSRSWTTAQPRIARLALACGAALVLGAGGTASLPPAEQLRRLEETGLDLARKAVEQKTSLAPFVFVVRSDGRTQRLAPKKTRRRQTTAQVVESLIEGLHDQAAAGAYDAVAVFRFVIISLPADAGESSAIHVSLEHESGHCEDVFVPYRKTQKGRVVLEPDFRKSREAQIFERCDPIPSSDP